MWLVPRSADALVDWTTKGWIQAAENATLTILLWQTRERILLDESP